MSIIQIENLNFSYPDALEPIFSDFNLRIDTDWKLGLIGKNGKGKTTLLNILEGKLKGAGRICSNVTFRRFPCVVSDTDKSVYEIAEKIAPETEFWQIQKEVSLMGLPDDILYRPFKTLSGGERTKFLLAVLFAGEGFPLLDEPTDHVDLDGRRHIAKYLSEKRGYIVVSHDRSFLDSCCDHIVALTSDGAELVRGNYSVWRSERDKREENERSRKQSLEKERVRLEKSAQAVKDWANKAERGKWRGNSSDNSPIDRGFVSARAAKMQKRSNAVSARRESAEENIRLLLKNYEETEALKITPLPFFSARLFSISDLNVSFSDKFVLKNISLEMGEGERVAITGKNGSGKSVFLKIIAGEFSGFQGIRNISPQLKISYVPQIADYCGLLSDYAKEYSIDESYFKAILSKFGFENKDFSRDMKYFSEGQKKKAALARSLCERAHIYICDEPLNYLDISVREQLTQAVVSSVISLIFVEHDKFFVNSVATRKLPLTK